MIDVGFSGVEPGLVDKYFATLLGVGLILAIASAARFYCVNWLGERVVADIRADIFKHLTGLSPAFYETAHSGEVMSRLTADTTERTNGRVDAARDVSAGIRVQAHATTPDQTRPGV